MIRSSTLTSVPPFVRYSIPRNVDTITLIKDVTACLSDLFLMLRISMRKSKLSVWLILKISLRMSSSTKFFLSSGAIWRALTLNDRRIYMIP